jgi:hypothetical protein
MKFFIRTFIVQGQETLLAKDIEEAWIHDWYFICGHKVMIRKNNSLLCILK